MTKVIKEYKERFVSERQAARRRREQLGGARLQACRGLLYKKSASAAEDEFLSG